MAPLARAQHPHAEDLSAYADHALATPATEAVEWHLRTCGSCSATVLAYTGIGDHLRRLPEVVPPTHLSWRASTARPRHAGLVRRAVRDLWGVTAAALRVFSGKRPVPGTH